MADDDYVPATDDDPNSRKPPIAFYDPSDWTGVTFSNDWDDEGVLQAVEYSKAASVVSLRGTAKATDVMLADVAMFTLPAAHWPPVAIKVPTLVDGVPGLLSITAAGVVSVNVAVVADDAVPVHVIFSTEATPEA